MRFFRPALSFCDASCMVSRMHTHTNRAQEPNIGGWLEKSKTLEIAVPRPPFVYRTYDYIIRFSDGLLLLDALGLQPPMFGSCARFVCVNPLTQLASQKLSAGRKNRTGAKRFF